jgi:peptidoglycan L-alanyl-D-glutamate endopeptidase CwlK
MLKYLPNAKVTPDIGRQAQAILNAHRTEPWGTQFKVVSAGNEYIARLERHYHEPGGALKPWGVHTGVSILYEDHQTSLIASTTAKFYLGSSSKLHLKGVDPRLVQLCEYAIEVTTVDFTVIEGLRTAERQAQLLKEHKTQTLQSRHLTGHAVDIAPWVNGTVSWAWTDFDALAPNILGAAKELGIPIEWGGNWKSFRDGPHWQIPWGK